MAGKAAGAVGAFVVGLIVFMWGVWLGFHVPKMVVGGLAMVGAVAHLEGTEYDGDLVRLKVGVEQVPEFKDRFG